MPCILASHKHSLSARTPHSAAHLLHINRVCNCNIARNTPILPVLSSHNIFSSHLGSQSNHTKHAIPLQTYVNNKQNRQAQKHHIKHETERYGVFFLVLRKSINHSKCPFTLIDSDVFFKNGHSAADVLHRWICAEKK